MFLGYVSRCCSDSDDSSDEDYPMDSQNSKRPDPASQDWEERRREEEQKRREEERKEREENEEKQEVKIIVTAEDKENEGGEEEEGGDRGATGSGQSKASGSDQEVSLETSWYHTDPRVTSSFSSLSSGSLSAALEESSAAAKAPSRLDALRGSRPAEGHSTLDVHHPYLLEPQRQKEAHQGQASAGPVRPTNLNYRSNNNSCLCFAELSQADFLPSPPEATSDDDDEEEEEEEEEELRRISKIPSSRDLRLIDSMPFQRSPNSRSGKKIPPKVPMRTSSIPGHKAGQAEQRLSKEEEGMFLTPSPNPKPALLVKESASESEDEFFDAQERFTPPVPDLSGKFMIVDHDHDYR